MFWVFRFFWSTYGTSPISMCILYLICGDCGRHSFAIHSIQRTQMMKNYCCCLILTKIMMMMRMRMKTTWLLRLHGNTKNAIKINANWMFLLIIFALTVNAHSAKTINANFDINAQTKTASASVSKLNRTWKGVISITQSQVMIFLNELQQCWRHLNIYQRLTYPISNK